MKVFVSHGSGDTWIAKQMARCIQEAGARTFIDAYDIEVGDRFEDKIVAEIAASNELVGLVTRLSFRRAWLHQEIGIARGMQKRICCVLYGVTIHQMRREFGIGLLATRDVIVLNDFDRYVSELATR